MVIYLRRYSSTEKYYRLNMYLKMNLCLLSVLIVCFNSKVIAEEPVIQGAEAIIEGAVESTINLQNEESSMTKKELRKMDAEKQVAAFLGSNEFIKMSGFSAHVQINALKEFQEESGLSGNEFWNAANDKFGSSVLKMGAHKYIKGGDDIVIDSPIDYCPMSMTVNCTDHMIYRTYDGTCNNLDFPFDGSTNRAYTRMIEAAYFDGIEEPRRSSNGSELKSARLITTTIHNNNETALSSFETLFHMTFGQLVDHDMDRTAVSKFRNNETGELVDVTCGIDGCSTVGLENSECFPIQIPVGDPRYPPEKTCLTFVRSAEFMKENCALGPREQANQITGWIDASMVYGSSKTETDDLRDTSNSTRGKMRTYQHPNFPDWKPFLPTQVDTACRDTDSLVQCFKAGDKRQNEHVGLTAMHTQFVRLHNKFEEELFNLNNANWDGEKLFQEAKRVVAAVWQNMIYNEYLPTVLGPALMTEYQLNIQQPKQWKGYNPAVTGDIINSFATAAFRFGHSQIPTLYTFSNRDYTQTNKTEFSNVLFRPESIWREHFGDVSSIDAIMLGQALQAGDISDRFFSLEMSFKLFKALFEQYGSDLAARNNQRGREHGLPDYLSYRQECNLPVGTDFNNLHDLDEETKTLFAACYDDVADIDLFAGGMSEIPVLGGMVGPTFACIIGRQFHNQKIGDRFWFENYKAPKWTLNENIFDNTRFTKKQMASIQEYTTGRLFCDTLDQVDTIQKYVMLQPLSEALSRSGLPLNIVYEKVALYQGSDNARVPCDQHPGIKWQHWRDKKIKRD